MLDQFVAMLSVFKNDIELNIYIHQFIEEIIKIKDRVLKREISLSVMCEIVDDLYLAINHQFPNDEKLANLFSKIVDNSDEIADLIGVPPAELNNIIKKMSDHTEQISNIIEASKILYW